MEYTEKNNIYDKSWILGVVVTVIPWFLDRPIWNLEGTSIVETMFFPPLSMKEGQNCP